MGEDIWQILTINSKIINDSVCLIKTDHSGRGLAAARSIEADEELFTESPLLNGPSQKIGAKFCFGCSKLESQIDGKTLAFCEKGCGATFCSERCEFKVRHKDVECEILKRSGRNLHDAGRWLSIFRSLLLKLSDKDRQWDALQLLEDHLNDRQGCEVMERNFSDVVKPLVELFNSNIFTPSNIVRICGILDSNSFRVDGFGTRALFALASMLNHDCAPNCRVIFDRNSRLTLKSKRKIQQDEELTITYCSPLMGTQARREKLRLSKYFVCGCSRCNDPSEFGSNLSSLRCPKCRKNVSAQCDGQDWICEGCGFETTGEKVDKLLKAVEHGIKEIVENREMGVEKFEEVLERRDKVLPPQHYLLLDLKLELLARYERIRSLASVERRLGLIKERISVLDKVDNGPSRLKGFLHYRLHNTLVEKVSLLHRSGKLQDTEAKEIGLQLKACLEVAAQCLTGDGGCPKDLPVILRSLQAN